MVGSNSTAFSNSKRRSFPWISRNKGKAEKAGFCKLQSPDGRRRYLRRGSKTSRMLQAAKNELDESVRTCSSSAPSVEFSLPSDSQEFSLNSVVEISSVVEEASSFPQKTWRQPSPVARKRQSIALLTSALAITNLSDYTEELCE